MNIKIVAAGLVALCLNSGIATGGDVAAGKSKASICAGCHGPKGVTANPAWPNLAGQNVGYFIAQIKAFKNGNRKNELMTPMAQALSDEDAANLAAYFKSLGTK